MKPTRRKKNPPDQTREAEGTDEEGNDHGAIGMLIAGGLILLLIFACDALMTASGLRFPGSFLALILLAGRFYRRGRPDVTVAKLFDATILVLPLFFVPAAIGIIEQLGLIADAWLIIVAAVIAGAVGLLAIVGRVAQFALARPQPIASPNQVQAE